MVEDACGESEANELDALTVTMDVVRDVTVTNGTDDETEGDRDGEDEGRGDNVIGGIGVPTAEVVEIGAPETASPFPMLVRGVQEELAGAGCAEGVTGSP